MEGDSLRCCGVHHRKIFQSTPSAWRETGATPARRTNIFNFNPLPPHGGRPIWFTSFFSPQNFNPLPPHGGRQQFRQFIDSGKYFNPLPPHGGRQNQLEKALEKLKFQSTPSAWRETKFLLPSSSLRSFQSTPSAWRETQIVLDPSKPIPHFNPLPPHGGRQATQLCACVRYAISIHSLRMEGDWCLLRYP